MNRITIEKVLTPKQIEEAWNILEDCQKAGQLPNKHLTVYLETIRPTLESRGVLPQYLAYALECIYNEANRAADKVIDSIRSQKTENN